MRLNSFLCWVPLLFLSTFLSIKELNAQEPFSWCKANGGEESQILFNLGEKYFLKSNYQRAFDVYREAAFACNRNAIGRLGLMHWNGLHIALDKSLAVEMFKKAAQLGEPRSQLLLGTWHKTGEFGFSKDMNAARTFFQAAFDQGIVPAGEQLGHAFFYGWGGEQSIEKALSIYKKTFEMGSTPFTSLQLGFIYNLGLGVQIDNVKAQFYYEKALLAGETLAAGHLFLLYEANDLFEEAAIWKIVDIELNGADSSDLEELKNLASKIKKSKVNRRSIALECISAKYANCPKPDLSSSRFKPLRSLKKAFNGLSYHERHAVQYNLKKLGLYSGKIDGIWGGNTSRGVVEFARSKDIPTRESDLIFSTLYKIGPTPKYSPPQKSRSIKPSKPDGSALILLLGALALSSGNSGFAAGLAGGKPTIYPSDDDSDNYDKDGFRRLRIDGQYLYCHYVSSTNTYTRCR